MTCHSLYFDNSVVHPPHADTASARTQGAGGCDIGGFTFLRNGRPGPVLGPDGNIIGQTYTAVMADPYSGSPTSDARFDNFTLRSVSNP